MLKKLKGPLVQLMLSVAADELKSSGNDHNYSKEPNNYSDYSARSYSSHHNKLQSVHTGYHSHKNSSSHHHNGNNHNSGYMSDSDVNKEIIVKHSLSKFAKKLEDLYNQSIDKSCSATKDLFEENDNAYNEVTKHSCHSVKSVNYNKGNHSNKNSYYNDLSNSGYISDPDFNREGTNRKYNGISTFARQIEDLSDNMSTNNDDFISRIIGDNDLEPNEL